MILHVFHLQYKHSFHFFNVQALTVAGHCSLLWKDETYFNRRRIKGWVYSNSLQKIATAGHRILSCSVGNGSNIHIYAACYKSRNCNCPLLRYSQKVVKLSKIVEQQERFKSIMMHLLRNRFKANNKFPHCGSIKECLYFQSPFKAF